MAGHLVGMVLEGLGMALAAGRPLLDRDGAFSPWLVFRFLPRLVSVPFSASIAEPEPVAQDLLQEALHRGYR